jgi:hypothetical protein
MIGMIGMIDSFLYFCHEPALVWVKILFVMVIIMVFWQVTFLASKVPAVTPSWIKSGVCHV